ncbi:hypothetical protein HJG54_19380 [Leptolyngbya sp. NK1-12]|uniref:LPXTG cell wall anchor domain-containing protein n=1 Tax=Leptolyngbya sp. NK1-12 TaxID=2547451 RepID=A0AA96WVZ2_9CYAN|nr:hypothetical protein [Leptolyngbya sp. NK1-12]WNZ24792.1 hypothetical protein HJG54_19380 [Leptolyngbya sp. NK1-12]
MPNQPEINRLLAGGAAAGVAVIGGGGYLLVRRFRRAKLQNKAASHS